MFDYAVAPPLCSDQSISYPTVLEPSFYCCNIMGWTELTFDACAVVTEMATFITGYVAVYSLSELTDALWSLCRSESSTTYSAVTLVYLPCTCTVSSDCALAIAIYNVICRLLIYCIYYSALQVS